MSAICGCFPELGRRGVLEDASRALTRQVLGRVAPAATAERTAVVIFAQNAATARRLLGRGRVIVLSNALSADTERVQVQSQRTSDLVYAGRLIPWKAPILALRALRYVRDPACVLRPTGRRTPRCKRRPRPRAPDWRLSGSVRPVRYCRQWPLPIVEPTEKEPSHDVARAGVRRGRAAPRPGTRGRQAHSRRTEQTG